MIVCNKESLDDIRKRCSNQLFGWRWKENVYKNHFFSTNSVFCVSNPEFVEPDRKDLCKGVLITQLNENEFETRTYVNIPKSFISNLIHEYNMSRVFENNHPSFCDKIINTIEGDVDYDPKMF